MAAKHLIVEWNFDEEALKQYVVGVMRKREEQVRAIFAKLWNLTMPRSTCWQQTTTQSPDVLSWSCTTS